MALLSKNVYIDKLAYIVNDYNHLYYTTIKMKPIDVKSSTYINFNEEIKDKDPSFEVGYHVRISKYKNIFAQGCTPNWSDEAFVITKVKK